MLKAGRAWEHTFKQKNDQAKNPLKKSCAPSVACHPFCLGPPDLTEGLNQLELITVTWLVCKITCGNTRMGFQIITVLDVQTYIYTWFILPPFMQVIRYTGLVDSAIPGCPDMHGELHWKSAKRKRKHGSTTNWPTKTAPPPPPAAAAPPVGWGSAQAKIPLHRSSPHRAPSHHQWSVSNDPSPSSKNDFKVKVSNSGTCTMRR